MKKYKGIEYIIHKVEETGHYCGYVRLPDNHKWNKLVDKTKTINLERMAAKARGEKELPKGTDKVVNVGYDEIPVDCHGGLTFSRRITEENKEDFEQGFTEGAWIGWDYAHSGDAVLGINGRKWTEEEVEEECKNVINQIKNND